MEKQTVFKSALDIQIRFNDIDALGHINNNVYLTYFDLGKSAYFEDLRGYPVNWLEGSIVIAHLEMDFLGPVFYNEDIVVETTVTRMGNKSGDFVQHIRNKKTNEVKCVCKSVFVYFDAATASSVPIPHVWREAIAKYEGKDFELVK